jgi:uncharacterized iron-regulated membrane protein
VAINWRVVWRKTHRWGAIVCALPFLVVIVSGLLLQVKKQSSWVQPPTQRGEGKTPTVSFAAILGACRGVPEAGIAEWTDIDRIDAQPSRGMAKVLGKNRWEIQVDLKTGAVLQSAYRRSDLIESLHDGSWFHDSAKLAIFLPSGAIVLGLWFTGMYLFALPWWVKWRKPKVVANGNGDERTSDARQRV